MRPSRRPSPERYHFPTTITLGLVLQSPFGAQKAEAQRGAMTCPRSHSQGESKPGFELGFLTPEYSPSPVGASVHRTERAVGVCRGAISRLYCMKGWLWIDGNGEGIPGSRDGQCLGEEVRAEGLWAESRQPGWAVGTPGHPLDFTGR